MDKQLANAALQFLNRTPVTGVQENMVYLQVIQALQNIINAPPVIEEPKSE